MNNKINIYLKNLNEINYFISGDNTYYNIDKWGNGSNTLFIVGLSGAGKTSLAKELSKNTGVNFFEMDNVMEDISMKLKKEITPEQWENKQLRWDMIDERVDKWFKSLQHKKGKYIIEGVFPLYYYNKSYFKDKPLIMMNTSILLSTIRSLKRNIKRDTYKATIPDIIFDIIETQKDIIKRIKNFEDLMQGKGNYK